MVKARIVNVVATASLNQVIDFSELRKFKVISYNSDVYGGRVAYFKDADMHGRVSIFNSGKLISVGTKSEKESVHELNKTLNFLVGKGFVKPIVLNPKIQNIVVTANLGSILNLDGLALASNIIYEPEQFPAVILRLKEPYKASILIFASGKVVITGLKTSEQIKPIMKKLQHFIETNQY